MVRVGVTLLLVLGCLTGARADVILSLRIVPVTATLHTVAEDSVELKALGGSRFLLEQELITESALELEARARGYEPLRFQIPAGLLRQTKVTRWPSDPSQMLMLRPKVLAVRFAVDPEAQVFYPLPSGKREFLGATGEPVQLPLSVIYEHQSENEFVVILVRPGYREHRVLLDPSSDRWPQQGDFCLQPVLPGFGLFLRLVSGYPALALLLGCFLLGVLVASLLRLKKAGTRESK